MVFLNHSYNDTPTIHDVAGADIAAPAMLAVKYSTGKLIVAGAGEAAMGIVLASQGAVANGGEMDVQINEGCLWLAGGTFSKGAELASDANGKAVLATAGAFILAIALEDGAANQPTPVQIVKCGYKPTPQAAVSLAALTDVTVGETLADGDTLTYDGTSEKWVNTAPTP